MNINDNELVTMANMLNALAIVETRLINEFKSHVDKLRPKQFYSVSEFSTLLGIEKQTIQKWCQNNILKATQEENAGKWLILASELDRIITTAKKNEKTDFKAKPSSIKKINAQHERN